jgi:hypothetical protein
MPVDFKDNFNETNYVSVHTFPYVRTKTEGEKREYLESLFRLFNSEDNPLVQVGELIQECQTHTSMSVGDVISYDGEFYLVMGIGFKLIRA